MPQTSLAPMENISDLFKKTFDFIGKNIKTISLIILIALSPQLIGNIIKLVLFYTNAAIGDNMAGFLFYLFAFLVLLAIISYLWGLLALFIFIKNEGLESRIGKLYGEGLKKIFSYSWILILRSLIIIVGMILFVIPGIIWAVYYSLSVYVFLGEGAKGSAALKKNKQLIKDYWWPVFFRHLLIFLILIIIGQVILLAEFVSAKSIYPFISFLLSTIFYFFILAFSSVYSFYIYKDLKRVKNQ